MEQTWRTIRSETRLKDRWLHLRVDHCVTPAGIEISPYYVLSYPDWVHVVCITEADSLVLVRQYRHAAGQSFLELPGGAVDPGDHSFERAARRELEEETGFTARQWEFITSLYPNPATHTNRVHFFLALDATLDRPRRLDPGEDGLRVELLDIPVVLNGLMSGLLGQAMHVSGFLLALAAAGRLDLTVA
jgi:8-oxo-dGTP pyrophosphatase MutT (NUDIX family)